ncbi:MAG: YihY/virulence factor BrkB family protein [Sphingobium sp.]|nr:YihY/virulence factor BrkB family protein [Sphingobium sp.]MCP5398488.1 YihY/virulence factor BrkB family protein [Sphingomonas sp.]
MQDSSPQSPEARRKRLVPGRKRRLAWRDTSGHIRPGAYSWEVTKRVAVGVYSDGFIHAGNMAYLSLLAIFPFFIVAATIASIFGRTQDGITAVNAFLYAVPPSVANVLRTPIEDVIYSRTGSGIVWFGVIVGLWTTASLIETIRDILRRAYGTKSVRPFWEYRLRAMGLIIASVILTMSALSAQIALTGAEQFLTRILPFADRAMAFITATKLLPLAVVMITLYALFYSLTPGRYRSSAFPKWPGAVFTALWWYGTLLLLPVILSHLSTYDLTYGSLAGVMITLIFFFLVGLGVVIGAELNAALAEFPNGSAGELKAVEEVDDA